MCSLQGGTWQMVAQMLEGQNAMLSSLVTATPGLDIHGLNKMALTLPTVEHCLCVDSDVCICYYILCDVCGAGHHPKELYTLPGESAGWKVGHWRCQHALHPPTVCIIAMWPCRSNQPGLVSFPHFKSLWYNQHPGFKLPRVRSTLSVHLPSIHSIPLWRNLPCICDFRWAIPQAVKPSALALWMGHANTIWW
jgi:hypothetical protein